MNPTFALRSKKALTMGIGALLAGLFLSAALLAGPSGAGASTDRDERLRDRYIRTVEPICFRDTRRNARILTGVREQVRQGDFAPAARRFRLATRAFTQTLRKILAVPRPQADRQTLNPWLRLVIKQRSFLAQISRALIDENGFEAQRLSVILMRNASQANTAVAGYGFNHCLIRPNRFL